MMVDEGIGLSLLLLWFQSDVRVAFNTFVVVYNPL